MIVDTAYDIQAKLLAGDSKYTPNYIFVEFKNVNTAGSTVNQTVPVTADDTIDYYSKLDEYCDYLAIPITLKPYTVEPTGENKSAVYYSVVTSGFTQGVNGLPFESGNSTIYGLGLVTRLADDGTNDILFARTFLPTEKQLVKATSDMYINWKIELK